MQQVSPDEYPGIIKAFGVLGERLGGKHVLNLAAYDGDWTKALRSGGAQVVSVDPTPYGDLRQDPQAYACKGEHFLTQHSQYVGVFDMVINHNMAGRSYWPDHLAMLPMIVTALKNDGRFIMHYEGFLDQSQKNALEQYFNNVDVIETVKLTGGLIRPDLKPLGAISIIKCAGPIKNVEREHIARNTHPEQLNTNHSAIGKDNDRTRF